MTRLDRARTDYDRDGHAVFTQALPKQMLLDLRLALSHHFNLGRQRTIATQPFDISTLVPAARRVKAVPHLAEIARYLLRAERANIWHDQVIIRPPQIGVESGWHQDFAFWPMKRPTALTCWIPLHDVDKTTGCLRFMRGSHRWGNRPSIVPRTIEQVFELSPDQEPDRRSVELPMRLGDCDFHHGLVFHGAPPNTSDQYRLTYKIIFMDANSEIGEDVFARAAGSVQPTVSAEGSPQLV
jgi:ectoine hydroxylase-related dioxygenase (phytanoyl-CoA dioxygenase family)